VLVLSAGVVNSLTALFAQPVFAVLLGIALGAGLLAASHASFRLMSAENPGAGLALVALLLFARMGFVVLVLWAYHTFCIAGFVPFATGFAGGFLVSYGIELARYAGVLRTRTR